MLTTIPVSRIQLGHRFRQDLGNIDELAQSLRTHGLLHPLVVTPMHELLCGGRRFEAIRRLNWETVEVNIVNIDDDNPLLIERDENETCKPFTASERVAIAKAIEERIGDRRQFQAKGNGIPQGESREIAAERAGFGSREEYRRASRVVEQGVPELVDAMDAGDVSITGAAELAVLPPEEQAEVVAQGPAAIKAKISEIRGKSRVNGELVDDPPDVAAARSAGRIGADVVPEVTDDTISVPSPEPEDSEPVEDVEAEVDSWLKSPLVQPTRWCALKTFVVDAKFYRAMSPFRDTFRRQSASHVRGRGARGEYAYRVTSFLKINDPRHWQRCAGYDDGGCAGTGQVPVMGECPECHGRGYWIR